MLKRMLIFIVIVAMVISLAACSRNEVTKEDNTQNKVEEKVLKLAEDFFMAMLYWDKEFLKENMTEEEFERLKVYKDDVSLSKSQILKELKNIEKKISKKQGFFNVDFINYLEIYNSDINETSKFNMKVILDVDIVSLKIDNFRFSSEKWKH